MQDVFFAQSFAPVKKIISDHGLRVNVDGRGTRRTSDKSCHGPPPKGMLKNFSYS